MKHYKRLGIYKASNVTYNPETEQAHSYRWWLFVTRINGKLVFNDYSYSVSTTKHQSKVRNLLNQLGVKINYTIEAPRGLDKLDVAVKHYENKILKLNDEINKPRSLKRKNLERQAAIVECENQIKLINALNSGTEFKLKMHEVLNAA